jgi:predicted permease
MTVMRGSVQDIRFGLRMLVKSPAFTLVAVLSLALGIGANTAIFSLVNALLLRPVPVHEPERVVALFTKDAKNPGHHPMSALNGRDISEQVESFSGLTVIGGIPGAVRHGEQEHRVLGLITLGNYFDVVGIEPQLGRFYSHGDDDASGGHPEIVLGHGFWTDVLGADPGILGQHLVVNGVPLTVVGVAPRGFLGTTTGMNAAFWAPWCMHRQLMPDAEWFEDRRWLAMAAVGRLAPGVTIEQAQAETDAVAARLERDHPEENTGRRFELVPLAKAAIAPDVREDVVLGSMFLMGIVGLVLLIACANVANLLLARASVRRTEIALRRALGADTPRLLKQMFTESMLLALLAGAVGVVLALWFRDGLLGLIGDTLPVHALDVSLDHRVLLFTLGISIATGVLFGITPALHLARADLVPALKGEGTRVAGLASRINLRNALVVVQIALSLVALVGAGLFVRSLQNARHVDPGFDVDDVLTVGVDFGRVESASGRRQQVRDRIVREIEAMPGVERAAFSASAPLAPQGMMRTTYVDGMEGTDAQDGVLHLVEPVMPGFFEALGIEVEGRPFTLDDDQDHPKVVVVTETMARRYWPESGAVGKSIRFFDVDGQFEIVGVIPDIKYQQITEDPQPLIFVSLAQMPVPFNTLLVRHTAGSSPSAAGIERVVRGTDAGIGTVGSRSMEQILDRSLAPMRDAASLLGAFGLLGLLLAGTGIYGVMAYTVRRRTHEIGIRLALGAKPGDVVRYVVLQGMALVVLGVGIGALAGLGVSALLSGALYQVGTADPIAFGGATAVLATVALVAGYVPARRATRINPMESLRHD